MSNLNFTIVKISNYKKILCEKLFNFACDTNLIGDLRLIVI